MSPISPNKGGRAGEGRRRQGLHTHTHSTCLWARGMVYSCHPPSPGETEAQRGAFANQRSLFVRAETGPGSKHQTKAEEDSKPCLCAQRHGQCLARAAALP